MTTPLLDRIARNAAERENVGLARKGLRLVNVGGRMVLVPLDASPFTIAAIAGNLSPKILGR